MLDTLKIAETLQEGQDGFPPAQARKLARAIAEASDDKRLRDLEVKVGVQTVLIGLTTVIMVAALWQTFALREEVKNGFAQLERRLVTFDKARYD